MKVTSLPAELQEEFGKAQDYLYYVSDKQAVNQNASEQMDSNETTPFVEEKKG